MPTRMIREALLYSDRYISLPDNTARICYIAMLLKADDVGNLEATDSALVRMWRDFGIENKDKSLKILQLLADCDLARIYEADGKRHVHLPRFNQRVRHVMRRCATSPWDDLNKINQVSGKTTDGSLPVDSPAPDYRRPEVKGSRSEVELKRREVEVKRSEEVVDNSNRQANALENLKTSLVKNLTSKQEGK